MAPNSARDALVKLARRKDLQLGASHIAESNGPEHATAQQAAVLILFGVDDGLPAASATGPGSRGESSTAGLDLLIVVRATTLRQHAGQPAFPGGKIDAEDYRLAAEKDMPVSYVAALREAVEETGLDPTGVEILGELAPVPLPVSNFMVTPVLAWWQDPSRVSAQDSNESSSVLRVPLADLVDPANRYTAQVRHGRLTHRSPAFSVRVENQDTMIWGFTGILLDRILQELGWARPWNRENMYNIAAEK